VARDVSRCCELARELGRMVEEAPDLELLTPVETSIVAFRWAPADADAETLHRVNTALGVAVQERGRAFVTGTVLGGHEAVRACLLNARTTQDDLRVLLDEVRAAATDLRLGTR
jgi:glutamate/tyrosine decarboxylase-like PLP-dependent enzyme